MPYVKQNIRKLLEAGVPPSNAGELNYTVTKTVLRYYQEIEGGYQAINDVLGALEGAKLEFYRRVAAPYEDTKIKENGDVY